ncbi:hypothetical protein K474DRAFT_1708112 [Panus rudis PR-1116 ss-1]|nr:hypothetical protein K474DRAFT_1708112 [Panus rudis PR-1116 ss-1]
MAILRSASIMLRRRAHASPTKSSSPHVRRVRSPAQRKGKFFRGLNQSLPHLPTSAPSLRHILAKKRRDTTTPAMADNPRVIVRSPKPCDERPVILGGGEPTPSSIRPTHRRPSRLLPRILSFTSSSKKRSASYPLVSSGRSSVLSQPFAMRSQPILSLTTAFAREDIRYRQEGFEVRRSLHCSPQFTGVEFCTSPIPSDLYSRQLLEPIASSLSEPSFYSTDGLCSPALSAHNDRSVYAGLQHSKTVSSPELSGLPCDSGTSLRSARRWSLGSISLNGVRSGDDSTMDEESFIRMAIEDLGW